MAAPRVLVVDDDPSIRLFAERALGQAGYEVVVAGDGMAALELVAAPGRPFDLFVLDLMMPRMTGDQLAIVLRRVEPDIKILYLTGFGDQLFKEKGMLWAHEAYLEKPVTVRGLLEAVSLLLYGHTQGPHT
jgi:two-component system, cell cycle sensor histidine kinase and response regulator CckA